MSLIALDIGHGNNTFPPGKGVYRGGKGYTEHDFNSKLAIRIKELLEENGHEVIYGQDPFSREVGLTTRTNLYNRRNVDLVISVHANAGVASASGRCAFYWHTSTSGKNLAQSIINEIKGKGYSTHGSGLHASKVGSWTNLHMVRVPKAPAVLVEHGFMTNANDFELVFGSKQADYIEDMAQADVAGIVKYLGGEPVEPSTPSKITEKSSTNDSDSTVAGARLVKNENAFFLVTVDEGIKVRSAPSTEATHTGTLEKGNSINYFKVYEGNGYRWLQYVGYSGNTLYVPYRPSNDVDNQWGTFHDSRPSGTDNKKSVEEVAQEIASGNHDYGNNPGRAQKLEAEGYNADQVQNRVNEILRGGSSSGSSSQSVKVGDTVTTSALYTTGNSTENVRSSNFTGYVDTINNNWRNEIRLRNSKGSSYAGFTRKQDLV